MRRLSETAISHTIVAPFSRLNENPFSPNISGVFPDSEGRVSFKAVIDGSS
jgi:hypothetical protein